MRVYIDIDDTLANTTRRQRLADAAVGATVSRVHAMIKQFDPRQMVEDEVMPGVDVVETALKEGLPITFLSARPEQTRGATVQWMAKTFPSFQPHQHTVILRDLLASALLSNAAWKVRELQRLHSGHDVFVMIDDDIHNRSAIRSSFPAAHVFSPEEGFRYLDAEVKGASFLPLSILDPAEGPDGWTERDEDPF